MANQRNSWEKVKAKIRNQTIGFEFSPKLINIIEKSFANSSWSAFQAKLQDPKTPWTLCHGDFHAGNMVLAAGDVFMVDWCQGIENLFFPYLFLTHQTLSGTLGTNNRSSANNHFRRKAGNLRKAYS